jgi:hypothetical protein
MVPPRSRACAFDIWIVLAATAIISPCNRNAAPSINPAASSFRAQAAPDSSAAQFIGRQFADATGDQPRTEIAVGLQIVRRTADDGGMSGQIDGIGMMVAADRLRGGRRQHGDGISNAKRKTAAVATAGGNPSRGIVSMNDHGSHQSRRVRPLRQAHGKMFAVGQMQRDVAAIVDISLLKWRALQHRAENLFRDGASDRRHRRDEMF